eukprot:gene20214-26243_t
MSKIDLTVNKVYFDNKDCYTDAHAHLIHEQFEGEEDIMAVKCSEAGLEYIVVNGLEPESNRKILLYSEKFSNILPACGIYPIDAMCNAIEPSEWKQPFPPPTKFNVDSEIEFIHHLAKEKKIIAIGECGLDRYYIDTPITNQEQERVLRELMRIGKQYDIPLILHTRKAEEKVLQMLIEEKVVKADFHCFCGKVKLGVRIAQAGYYLSIPSAVERVDSFQKLVAALPIDKILTETDCPYMGPDKGVRNDPTTVPRGVAAIAKVKNITENEMKIQIRNNFKTLFNI